MIYLSTAMPISNLLHNAPSVIKSLSIPKFSCNNFSLIITKIPISLVFCLLKILPKTLNLLYCFAENNLLQGKTYETHNSARLNRIHWEKYSLRDRKHVGYI